MTTRLMFKAGAVVLAAGLFGACSSDDPTDGGATAERPSSSDTLAPVDPAITTGVPSSDAGTAAPASEEGMAVVDDLCTVIPDLAAIEAIIGIPVEDPLSIGDAGSQQTCGLIASVTGGKDVTFTLSPNWTIAAQIKFIEENFANYDNMDIVALEGAEGFYAGEGESVYWEGNGGVYQVQALVDGDSRTASLDLLRAWLEM